MLFRSLVVQGSWNYQTLIGTGFAFMLLPALRHIFVDDEKALADSVRRHMDVFNSHPYLATVAAGAVARMEADRAPAELIHRFKAALRSSLGALGDQLVWRAWRPACALFAIVLLLVDAPWWLAVGCFLVTYNSLHIALRVWGLSAGLREGIRVSGPLKEAPFHAWGRHALNVGALLAGLAIALILAETTGSPVEIVGTAAASVIGLWFGVRSQYFLWALLAAVWLLGMLVGITARTEAHGIF